jgi:diadenosine tetraphosphatase ApaH/serine/threonine PP2A family protein phosphatase
MSQPEDRPVPQVKPPEHKILELSDVFPNLAANVLFGKNTNRDPAHHPNLDPSEIATETLSIPNHEMLKNHFLNEGKVDPLVAKVICNEVIKIFKHEKNLLALDAPVTIFGDIHGQYFDLVNMMEKAGPVSAAHHYLFLGDYVDRGYFGCEIIMYLFALKINYPNQMFMIRGNHECRLLTTHFNFRKECLKKYDVGVYDAIMDAFDALPLGAIVTCDEERFLCLHGGLSPHFKTIDDIQSIDRFQEPGKQGPLCDILWSDPLSDETGEGLTPSEMQEWYDVRYEPNPERGCGYIFGYAATAEFLQENKITSIIRAHEVEQTGYKEIFFRRKERVYPMVITVFSAPNYCGMYRNQGAVLRLMPSTPPIIHTRNNPAKSLAIPKQKSTLSRSATTSPNLHTRSRSRSVVPPKSPYEEKNGSVSPRKDNDGIEEHTNAEKSLANMKKLGPHFHIEKFSDVSHPFWLPSFQNAIEYAMPYVLEKVAKIALYLASMEDLDDEDDAEYDEMLREWDRQRFEQEAIERERLMAEEEEEWNRLNSPDYKKDITDPNATDNNVNINNLPRVRDLIVTQSSREVIEIIEPPQEIKWTLHVGESMVKVYERPQSPRLTPRKSGQTPAPEVRDWLSIQERIAKLEKRQFKRRAMRDFKRMSESRRMLWSNRIFMAKYSDYINATTDFGKAKLADRENERIPWEELTNSK